MMLSLFCAGAAAEETRYISDELMVPLRSSPCNTCKIIHYGIKAGTKLSLLEVNDEQWAKVVTPKGQEGWLPSRYLVSQQIAKYRIADVEKQLADLKKKNQQLANELKQKSQNLDQLQTQFSDTNEQKMNVANELSELKALSADAINLSEQNQKLVKLNSQLSAQINVLEASNQQLKNDQSTKWFLYGLLALFMGAVLTAILPRLKVKRRYTEWG